MDIKLDLIVLGEGLIELSSDVSMSETKNFAMNFGGDTLAAAIAARKMGSKVGYITKIGCDHFEKYLLNGLNNAGIDISQTTLVENANNGLYLLARPEHAEKEFSYYRKKTAASKLSVEDINREYFEHAKCFYTSSTAQSLSLNTKDAVKQAYALSRDLDIITAYDPNFSPLITTKEEAVEFFNDVNENLDILFLNDRYDMTEVLDKESIEETLKYCSDLGIKITVIKSLKNKGYYVGYMGENIFIPFIESGKIVDSTCAGDAFNGGFLHAYLSGLTPFDSAKFASVVAGLQIKGIGAIKSIPSKEEVEAWLEK